MSLCIGYSVISVTDFSKTVTATVNNLFPLRAMHHSLGSTDGLGMLSGITQWQYWREMLGKASRGRKSMQLLHHMMEGRDYEQLKDIVSGRSRWETGKQVRIVVVAVVERTD